MSLGPYPVGVVVASGLPLASTWTCARHRAAPGCRASGHTATCRGMPAAVVTPSPPPDAVFHAGSVDIDVHARGVSEAPARNPAATSAPSRFMGLVRGSI